MRKFWQNHGLAITAFGIFFIFWVAMGIAGYFDYNQQQQDHGRVMIAFWPYFATGHFWEATFENWESEYLQMGLFVLLTAYLFQKGSAESKTKKEHEQEQQEETQEEHGDEPEEQGKPTPKLLQRSGWLTTFYNNSLSIALLTIFILCFIFHGVHGAREYNLEQSYVGQSPVTVWKFFTTPAFWFQSFQNWQSEFLAVGSMVVLTIYLRQKGSAESKRVGAPSAETGGK